MDVVLIILGILGFGAIVIAAYVFTVAARNYVSEDDPLPLSGWESSRRERFVVRNGQERRRGGAPVKFPMTINSKVIPRDRLELPERRAVA